MRKRDLYHLIQPIKEQANLKEYASQYINFNRYGKALCPFRAEKTPSFSVSEYGFHCFGCGISGNIIRFVEKYHGLSFWQAVEHLAKYAGLSGPTSEREVRTLEKRTQQCRAKNKEIQTVGEVLKNIVWNWHDKACEEHGKLFRKEGKDRDDYTELHLSEDKCEGLRMILSEIERKKLRRAYV